MTDFQSIKQKYRENSLMILKRLVELMIKERSPALIPIVYQK